jgi:hypothetical protein
MGAVDRLREIDRGDLGVDRGAVETGVAEEWLDVADLGTALVA